MLATAPHAPSDRCPEARPCYVAPIDVSDPTSPHSNSDTPKDVPNHTPMSVSESKDKFPVLEPLAIDDQSTPAVARLSIDSVFNPFEQDEDALLLLAMDIFKAAGLIADDIIPEHNLFSFLWQVRTNYHAINPYHNWNHAVHVLFNCFRFVRDSLHLFSRLDIMSLLISAICHDVDHSGLTNRHYAQDNNHPYVPSPIPVTPTNPNRADNKAATYFLYRRQDSGVGLGLGLSPLHFTRSRSPVSSSSSHQSSPVNRMPTRNSISITSASSMSNGSEKKSGVDPLHYLEINSIKKVNEIVDLEECNIFVNLNVEDRHYVADSIEDMILCTDVSDPDTVAEVRRRWRRQAMYCEYPSRLDSASAEDRELFFSDFCVMILLCADVGIIIEPFDSYILGVRALYMENKAHSPITAHDFCKKQIAFLNGYGLDTFKQLSKAKGLVPSIDMTAKVLSNRERFEEELKHSGAAQRLMGDLPNSSSSEAWGPPSLSLSSVTELQRSNSRESVAAPHETSAIGKRRMLRYSQADEKTKKFESVAESAIALSDSSSQPSSAAECASSSSSSLS